MAKSLEVNLKGRDKPIHVHDYERVEVEQDPTTTRTERWLVIYGSGDKKLGRYNIDEVQGYHEYDDES